MQGQIEHSKVIDLTNLIEYADGAVVSRTIIDKNIGTLTLFAFDAGQGLSEHSAPFDALVHILDGEMEITIGREKVTVGTGQITLMPADIPHSLRANVRSKMLLTMIKSA